jgi:hypothetical protein
MKRIFGWELSANTGAPIIKNARTDKRILGFGITL